MYWTLFRQFIRKYGRPPYGEEIARLKTQAKEIEGKSKIVDITDRLGPDAPYSKNNPEGWMPSADEESGIMSRLKGKIDDLKEQSSKYKDMSVGDFVTDYFGMSKKAETEAEMIARMNKQNKDAVKRLKDKKIRSAEEIMDDGDFDPSGMKDGGRIGYAFGRGLRLANLLKKEGVSLKDAIQESIDDFIQYSGDLKYDADAVLDDMFERLSIDRDSIDQYDVIDAYGKVYDNLSMNKMESMYERAAEQELEGLGTGVKKTRNKNAGGGLNYLMGF